MKPIGNENANMQCKHFDIRLWETDPCPCGSGKPVKQCCLQAGGKLVTPPVDICLPPPKTGYAHARCYAATLSDCSTKISREHFVSEVVLNTTNRDRTVRASGFSWQKGRSHLLPTSNVASNILCERHNRALGELDIRAGRMMNTLLSMAKEFQEAEGSHLNRVSLFNGYDLERWLLKVLCGYVSAGNAVKNDQPIPAWKPSRELLEILVVAQ